MPRRILEGRVVSDKQNQTITVLVERRVMHPLYKKFVRKTKKFAAHDEGNTAKVGDFVQIEECRPLSKRKRFRLIGGAGAPAKTEKAAKPAAKKDDEAELKKPATKKKATKAKKDDKAKK